MRFWSEGLGERQLVIGLDRAALNRKGEILELSGVVDSPAPWEYEIKMDATDWEAILKTAARRDTGRFIVTHASFAQLGEIASTLAGFLVRLSLARLRHLLGFGSAARTGAAEPLEGVAQEVRR